MIGLSSVMSADVFDESAYLLVSIFTVSYSRGGCSHKFLVSKCPKDFDLNIRILQVAR
jgi:hypothetical protein